MPNNNTSQYITITAGSTVNSGTTGYGWEVTGSAGYNNSVVSLQVAQKSRIAPELYFKYIKKKFGIIEGMKLNARLKRLESAFNKAVENGQDALGTKILADLSREARESTLYACGIKHFIEHDDLNKHKRNIRGGHISDTKYADFTRVIPDNVIAKKKKVEHLFDGFVIYHYWNDKAELNRIEKQKMTPAERSAMRDPVLFGVIRESNRLYFIADWEDELCDLTFEEIIDHIGKEDDEITIQRQPKLSV